MTQGHFLQTISLKHCQQHSMVKFVNLKLIPLQLYCFVTVYAIIFAYRYFHDFGLRAEIREGLISQFF